MRLEVLDEPWSSLSRALSEFDLSGAHQTPSLDITCHFLPGALEQDSCMAPQSVSVFQDQEAVLVVFSHSAHALCVIL